MFKCKIWIHQTWHRKTTFHDRNRKDEDDLQTVDAPRWHSATVIKVERSDLCCQVRQDTDLKSNRQSNLRKFARSLIPPIPAVAQLKKKTQK